jgi:hypothetical protein
MDLSLCDCGAGAPSADSLRPAQTESKVPNETDNTSLDLGWTGLLPWLGAGAGLSPTSLFEESDR